MSITFDIIDQLREEARSTSRATKAMSAAKSARNQAAGDEGASYAGLEPEETVTWRAADVIKKMRTAIHVECHRLEHDWNAADVATARSNLLRSLSSAK